MKNGQPSATIKAKDQQLNRRCRRHEGKHEFSKVHAGQSHYPAIARTTFLRHEAGDSRPGSTSQTVCWPAWILSDFNPKRMLYKGGWYRDRIPRAKHTARIRSILNVRNFYLNYTTALLDEFGSDIDALVWDETHLIRPDSLGTNDYPGYVGKAMMHLISEIVQMVENYNRKTKHR